MPLVAQLYTAEVKRRMEPKTRELVKCHFCGEFHFLHESQIVMDGEEIYYACCTDCRMNLLGMIRRKFFAFKENK